MKLRNTDILHGSYEYNAYTGVYVGLVARIRGTELTVCTVGVEATEYAVAEWVRTTIELMRSSGSTDVQAADMVDRARAAPPLQ